MIDVALVDGDTVVFESMFGQRTVVQLGPMTIRGSGHALIGGRRVCVVGDEASVQVNASYSDSQGFTAGTGTISIIAIAPDQTAPWCRSGPPVLLRGGRFSALFKPIMPATNGTAVDPIVAPSIGGGWFEPTQSFVRVG